jgi:hypothetical protein
MLNHTVLGVWVVETRYPDRPRIDRGTLLFHEGGGLSVAFADYAAHAVWTATGDRSAAVLGVRPVGPNEGFVGMYELQGTITVSDDGATCQMPAVQRRPRPDGSFIEQSMTITGQRLKITAAGGS